jgi:hypothetical protein
MRGGVGLRSGCHCDCPERIKDACARNEFGRWHATQNEMDEDRAGALSSRSS